MDPGHVGPGYGIRHVPRLEAYRGISWVDRNPTQFTGGGFAFT